jgi:TctA family transporter
MIGNCLAALQLLADPQLILLVLAGTVLGLIFGILPGLSGLTALALLLPFVYGMQPMTGLAFLLATHAAVVTGGSVTACLLGIPGAPANAATVADGFALQQEGKGMYAVGAALGASALGGLFGAVVLAVLLPMLQPVILAFGAPDIFLLGLIGIAYVAVLGQGEPWKGLFAASLGLLLAMIGYQRSSGDPRFWAGSEYLLDGIHIIPLVLGLLSIPEIVSLAGLSKNSPPPQARLSNRYGMWLGAKAVLRHPGVFLRSTLIGILVGIVPGVGGETAPFMAYAAAKKNCVPGQSDSRIIGVIAPESSSNAKEGGALVPTLALGIPGSAGMALMLGAFLILGLEPGPDFLTVHMDLALALAIVLAVTNVAAALLMAPLAAGVASLARLRGTILAPVLLILIVLGAYACNREIMDVAAVFVFGFLGILMKHLNYSRPALILGFVLGPIIETYWFISTQAYGIGVLARPITLVLLALLVGGVVSGFAGKCRASVRRSG